MDGADDLVMVTRARALSSSGMARSIRIAAGASLPEFARVCGVSVSTVWRWERSQRRPRGEPAVRYAHLLEELARR
jgi:DNA-binding transcriptional regulator YiaG